MRGKPKGGKEVVFGTYGLQATESHWITNRQIDSLYRYDTLHETWWERYGLKIFPHKSYAAKAIGGSYGFLVKGHLKDGLHQLNAVKWMFVKAAHENEGVIPR